MNGKRLTPTELLAQQLHKLADDVREKDERILDLERHLASARETIATNRVKVESATQFRTQLLLVRANMQGATARLEELLGIRQ